MSALPTAGEMRELCNARGQLVYGQSAALRLAAERGAEMRRHAARITALERELGRYEDYAVVANAKLAALIDSGQFDWDNPHHRTAYLREWVAGKAGVPGGEHPVGLLEGGAEPDPRDDAGLLHQ